MDNEIEDGGIIVGDTASTSTGATGKYISPLYQ